MNFCQIGIICSYSSLNRRWFFTDIDYKLCFLIGIITHIASLTGFCLQYSFFTCYFTCEMCCNRRSIIHFRSICIVHSISGILIQCIVCFTSRIEFNDTFGFINTFHVCFGFGKTIVMSFCHRQNGSVFDK